MTGIDPQRPREGRMMTRYERLLKLRELLITLGNTGPTNARLIAVDRAIATARPWRAWC